MEKIREAVRAAANELAETISAGAMVGLGSGSTVTALLEELAPILKDRGVPVRGVPTSSQIERVAERCGIPLVPFGGMVDIAIDGADQVDEKLNLVKGGGGALMKEKVVMGSAKKTVIVASAPKFSANLCDGGVKVPVEVHPMARGSVSEKLRRLGGTPEERLLPKGYPYFTENGNIIMDTGFEPIRDPRARETSVKSIPGVMEVGIFTFKPITVVRLSPDGGHSFLQSDD